MRRSIAFLAVLITAMFLWSMSDASKEEPKQKEINKPKFEIQKGEGFITEEELNRIAINFYKYYFEEEHEWRGMVRKDGEGIIKNVTPFKENETILAYMVNYNPMGHLLIKANKNTGAPLDQYGSDTWNIGVEEGFLDSFDKRLHPMIRDGLHRLKQAIDKGELQTKGKDLEKWQKFNVPVDSFKEKADYENNTYKPDWWLEKKKSKNTQGMIQTEWNQK